MKLENATLNSMVFFSIWSCTVNTAEPPTTCNGFDFLCDRKLNEVAFAATHNSMSSAEDEWIAPNHLYAIVRQLDDGIRGLNLDTYMWQDQPFLCHGFCELGATPLTETLEEIKFFVDSNPQEIIIITLQSGLDGETTRSSFEQSGLLPYLYTHTQGQAWPTLRELIEQGTPLVLFSNSDGNTFPGYHSQWEHWLDNPYSAKEIEDFSCEVDRGEPETASLFNVNHFLTNPIALEQLANEANQNPVLPNHVFDCWEKTSRFPNQVLVDFYSIGELFDVVEELNHQFPQ